MRNDAPRAYDASVYEYSFIGGQQVQIYLPDAFHDDEENKTTVSVIAWDPEITEYISYSGTKATIAGRAPFYDNDRVFHWTVNARDTKNNLATKTIKIKIGVNSGPWISSEINTKL